TKSQTDMKFLGKQESAILNFDNIVDIGIFPNFNSFEILNQTNSPAEKTGMLTNKPIGGKNFQTYTTVDGEIFTRVFESSEKDKKWLKTLSESDVSLATSQKAGVFKINEIELANEKDTVPTTSNVYASVENLRSEFFNSFAPLVHNQPGNTITSAVNLAKHFEVPEEIIITGDVISTAPVFLSGGETSEINIEIIKKAGLVSEGIVSLSDDFNSKSISKAATANSVSVLYDMIVEGSEVSAYVKKSGDVMTGELETPSLVSNEILSSTIVSGDIYSNSANIAIVDTETVRLGGEASLTYNKLEGCIVFSFSEYEGDSIVSIAEQEMKLRNEQPEVDNTIMIVETRSNENTS
ncbi:MAG: pyocin knob domain-containing protein, partial [Culicoidibacterales bacterium]